METFEPFGILPIDKPSGMTSHDVVGKIRRLYHTKKVGHTGTLDPMATGVLILLLGRAAKAAEYLTSDKKTYEATLRLGMTTDTEDITGTVLTTSADIPDEAAVLAAIDGFHGDYAQIPPMVSALKVGGKKLVDLARKGIEIERKPRPVFIYSIKATRETSDTYRLFVKCSAGTYIRTLCADIGKALGCGGTMASLRRHEAGGFSLDSCYTLENLEEMSPEARTAALLPTESVFSALPTLSLPAFFERLARSGCEIYQKKLGTDHAIGERLRITDEKGHFFAIGEIREYPDGSAMKILKLFEL